MYLKNFVYFFRTWPVRKVLVFFINNDRKLESTTCLCNVIELWQIVALCDTHRITCYAVLYVRFYTCVPFCHHSPDLILKINISWTSTASAIGSAVFGEGSTKPLIWSLLVVSFSVRHLARQIKYILLCFVEHCIIVLLIARTDSLIYLLFNP